MLERRDEQHGMKNVRENIKWYRVNTYENMCSNEWKRDRERERERERELLEHRGQRFSKPILENTQKVMLT